MLKIETKIFCLSMMLLCSLSAYSQSPPKVSKIEPPNWWANHSINPVRLLVRGENLQKANVTNKNRDLAIGATRTTKDGKYLFVSVLINDAKPGKYSFDVTTPNGKTSIPFEISAPLDSKTNFQGITNDDVIYLIMTDRFADGDVSNNKDVDRNNPRAWHGGDFKGITKNIAYLKELGITAIWLTPWYDNSDEITNCDKPWCPMTSYHGYGAIDYYGTENHFGTFADLREMIETAHKNGIKVIQDQVANHISFKHPWVKNPPLDNWIPPFVPNNFNNSVLLSPNGSQAERDNLLKGWFDFSLPDLNQEEPEVAEYEIQNALWWIAATGIDGIRQDTIQYMPRPFIRDWSAAILKQYPNFYMVGEIMKDDSAQTAFFQGGKIGWDGVDTKLPSVFDFKLWQTSEEVFTGKKPASALRDVLKYDGLYADVDRITTLQNNHDTDRFMSLSGATKEGAKLHTAFMLATRGIPQLYYGEEILMTGGHDPDNRKDFSGGWADDKINKFTREGRIADEQEMFEWTQKWISLRKKNKIIQKGQTIDLFYDDDVYAFARFGYDGSDFGSQTHIVFPFNKSDVEKRKKIKIEPVRDGFGLCFKNVNGMEDPYQRIEFEKEAVKLSVNQQKCFNTKQNEFYVKIPPQSVIAFNIYRFP